ncbi:MAG: glycoside hydrolase family 25 [Ruminococcus sp.]|nr:glycoside hydrolase family 25 [Ruminococcus sp.]
MKKKYCIACIAAFCMLTACGKSIVHTPETSEETLPAMAEITEEKPGSVSAAETEAVTAAVSSVQETLAVSQEPPEGAVLTTDNSVEVYEEITLGELLLDSNVQLENGEELVDTSETGTFDVTVSYTYEDKRYVHSISYTVSDTTAPTLLNSGWNVVIERGESFDLNDYVGFADNYDRAPVLTYEGAVDTNTVGNYPLTASVTDASGNVTSWELYAEVVDEIPVPEDNNERLPFEYFTEQYAGENVRFGIDVSTWQGDIDFEAVRNAGCSFVIMRIGHYYDEITMDDCYLKNMEAAKAAGLDVGVYIYTTANTEEKVRENARWIIQQLDGQVLDFPVVFDWESFSNFQKYGMSIHDLNTLFEVFADEMEQNGYSAMLYSSKNFLENFWYDHSEVPVWLAHYTDQTDYAGAYAMWQMSCFGRIDGIAGDVDLNILYTDQAME